MNIGFQKELNIRILIPGRFWERELVSFSQRLNYVLSLNMDEGGVESIRLSIPSQDLLIPYPEGSLRKVKTPELLYRQLLEDHMVFQPSGVIITIDNPEDFTILHYYVY